MLCQVASHPTPVRVHVEADTRLAEAGLVRAAGRAGLEVVPNEESACLTLRSATLPLSEPDLEVSVGGEGVNLVVREMPNKMVWIAVLRLIREFLAETDPGE